jgi:hypothetical protein
MLEIALALIPLLLLLGSLAFGRYPGIETIVRLVERAHATLQDGTLRRSPRPPLRRHRAASGGLLIAFARAQRPPPLPA